MNITKKLVKKNKFAKIILGLTFALIFFSDVGLVNAICSIGDVWTAKDSVRNMSDFAMSSDGKFQVAFADMKMYASYDYGNTWNIRDSVPFVGHNLVISSDGKFQSAVMNIGKIYSSSDYGFTWTERDSDRSWHDIAMSSDGKFQVAVDYAGKIYSSSDFGASWLTEEAAGTQRWIGIAMSADGKRQTAVVDKGQIYISADFGKTWTAKDSARNWSEIAMSSDGKIQTALDMYGQIYISANYGDNWTAKDSARNWSEIAMSSDGKIQTALALYAAGRYISFDYGNTWTAKDSREWSHISMSANGEFQAAIIDKIFHVSFCVASTPTPTPTPLSTNTTCTASFSLVNAIAPGESKLSWSSSENTTKLIISCTEPLPLPEKDYGVLNYPDGYPFSFKNDQIGTETCTFTPYNGEIKGTPCVATVTVKNSTASTPTPTPTATACGSAANNNYTCDTTQTSGVLCASGTCYAAASSPPTLCLANIQFSGNHASWYCGTAVSCSASKLSSCSTPTPTPSPSPIPSSTPTPTTTPAPGGNSVCDNNGYLCCSSSNPTYKDGLCTYPSLQYGDMGRLRETCDMKAVGSDCVVVDGRVILWLPDYPAHLIGWPNSDPGLANVAPSGAESNFRIFFPPGSARISPDINYSNEHTLYIYNTRYNKIPEKAYTSETSGIDVTLIDKTYYQGVEFDGYKSKASREVLPESLISMNDPLSVTEAGWAYFTGKSTNTRDNSQSTRWLSHAGLSIWIDAKMYNDWRDHSGSNTDGSINWAKDVEGVTTYVAPTQTSPTPTPSITPTPSPTPILTTPTCEINFTKTKDDQTKITSATEGDTNGQWQKITNYDATKQDAYSVCEDERTITLTKINPTNQIYTGKDWKFNYNGHVDERCYILFFQKNETPKLDWSNRLSSCQTELIKVSEIPQPTGPDCATKTCKGNSCDSQNKALDNPWISGTKTEGCATITATVEPSILTTPGSTFIKWTSTGASKMEAECFSGPVILPLGGWFTSDAKCKESGLKECTDKGYEFIVKTELTGTETCKFYPTNLTDSQKGTPLIFTFEVKKASATPTPTPATHTFTANPTSIATGQTTTLSWTATNAYDCAVVLMADGNGEPTSLLQGQASSGSVVTPALTKTRSFYFTCKDLTTKLWSDLLQLTVTVTPASTPTPTPIPTSQQKACENNCEQDVCVSKFCKDNCGELVRGMKVGC